MPSREFDGDALSSLRPQSAVRCADCRSLLWGDGEQSLSFLLIDELTIPVLSCDAHLEQFNDICGFTTSGTASVLRHRPAGGIPCPSCRLAPYNAAKPLIPVRDGAIAPLACAEHQTQLVERFRTGLETRQELQRDIRADSSL